MESIISYNEMIDAVNKRMENENDEHDALRFMDSLVNHRLNSDKKTYSVKVKWSNGEYTWEPLWQMAEDDPVTCAKYAEDSNLLDLEIGQEGKDICKNAKASF